MADIFISYKSEDRDWAAKINALAQSAGYTTWWDPALQTGEHYNDRIHEELSAAEATIVIWSSRSWRSKWVKEEALFARDRERLCPVKIDDIEIGVPFYTLQTLNLSRWDGSVDSAEAHTLLQSLERLVPLKLRADHDIYVYWTRGNDGFISDNAAVDRFLERVVIICSTVGVRLHIVEAWNHIVNPHTISDRTIYERDLNILVFFGDINPDGFGRDVFCPGLDRLFVALNPYVIHVGHHDFYDLVPQRKVQTRPGQLPAPDTIAGDSAIEALASFIAFRVLQVRQTMKPTGGS